MEKDLTVETPQVPTQEISPELNIADLQNIRAIIDTAIRRGAFGGAEASAVGAVFDRLNTFLNAVTADQPSEKQG
jgi:hypothetical protein